MAPVVSSGSAVLDAMKRRIREQSAEYASFVPEGSHDWAPVNNSK